MKNSESQSESEQEMSFEQSAFQDFSTDGHSGPYHQTSGQERGGCALPNHRLVILSLGTLNAVLLIAAVVIGIFCAKGSYLQAPNSAATPLILEMNHLRNHTDIIRAKVEAQAALARERSSHAKLKLQVKQTMTLTDNLQRQIEALNTEKKNLHSNKTALEQSCGRCPQGWRLLKSSCYFYSHHESNPKKNWPDSRKNCISQGGDLLVINNLEEQQLMIDNFPKVGGGGSWWENGFWIGLTDVITAGTWVWVNNVTEVETVYWKIGQPTRAGLQSGNCAAFYSYTDNRGAWYNGNCEDHRYNWICEMEPRQT